MVTNPKKVKQYSIPTTSEPRATVSSAPLPPIAPSAIYGWSSRPGYQPSEQSFSNKYEGGLERLRVGQAQINKSSDNNDNKFADRYISTSEKLFAPPVPAAFKSFSGTMDINVKPKILDMKMPSFLSDTDGDGILDKNSPRFKKVRDMLGMR